MLVPPVNPGPEPNIPAGATGATIANLWYHHVVATKTFTKYNNTDKNLCQLLLASTEELYVRYLRHKYIGYRKTTTRALIDHLYSTYADISASALQNNDARLRSLYESNQTFEKLIYKIENAVNYASTRDTPYTPSQIVEIDFQILFQTGLFNDDCKIWRRSSLHFQSYNNFH